MKRLFCLTFLIALSSSLGAQEQQIFKKHGVRTSEPVFLEDLNLQRSEVAYFGFGAQHFMLQPAKGPKTNNTDSSTNGVAFNLGYFTRDWVAEYAQQILLTDLDESLIFDDEEFDFVNVVQHHFLVQIPRRLVENLHFSFGGGLQLSEVHLFSDDKKEDEKLKHEYSILMGFGLTFFMTKTVSIKAQLARAMAAPVFNDSKESIFKASEIFTVFLEYYFSLK